MEKYTRIKEVMKEHSVTATEIAGKLGITSGTLSGIINGNPTVNKLAEIADAMNADLKELIK